MHDNTPVKTVNGEGALRRFLGIRDVDVIKGGWWVGEKSEDAIALFAESRWEPKVGFR